jgi:hypothetical protein
MVFFWDVHLPHKWRINSFGKKVAPQIHPIYIKTIKRKPITSAKATFFKNILVAAINRRATE